MTSSSHTIRDNADVFIIADQTAPDSAFREAIKTWNFDLSANHIFWFDVDDYPQSLLRLSGQLVNARFSRVIIAGFLQKKSVLRQICRTIWEKSSPEHISLLKIDEETPENSKLSFLQLSDLVGRSPVRPDITGISEAITGKRVLVTGAGGSFGKVMVKKLLDYHPSRIIALDIDETELFLLEQEWHPGSNQVDTFVGDITDKTRMEQLFKSGEIDLVIHTAAYKHVPVMERHPLEAARVNVLGTALLADLADRYGVESMLTLSTDKAVQPVNVMGYTKKITELVSNWYNSLSECRFSVLRIGNLLGSRGSVVPLFTEQIRNKKPVTITDAKTERFFIPIPDSVNATLHAAAISDGGEVFLVDMGEPVRITELAELMIRYNGYKPGLDIPMVYSGLREGEKLSEQLAEEEEIKEGTPFDFLHIITSPDTVKNIDQQPLLQRMSELIRQQDESGIRELLLSVTRTPDITPAADR